MMPARSLHIVLVAGTLSGCTSLMSGIGGSERYACKAPEGVACMSVSGAYANSVQGAPPPSQSPPTRPPAPPGFYGAMSVAPARSETSSAPASRIRSDARLLRVWIAPWEDSDGDLHEEAIVHVIIDSGRWLIDHVRPSPRNAIDNVAPPLATPESPPPAPPADKPMPGSLLPPSPGAVVPGTNMVTGEH